MIQEGLHKETPEPVAGTPEIQGAQKLHINIEAMQSLHRFGDILENAIETIESDIVRLVPDRESPDCIGRHWYGMRCHCESILSGQKFYFHIGLIYHPDTRVGLMTELDEKNNRNGYSYIKSNIQPGALYEINLAEPEYFKLFMPDETFEKMQQVSRYEQTCMIADYVRACAEAVAKAAYGQGFALDYSQLHDARNLGTAFASVLKSLESDEYTVAVNEADKDNFGQYAEGFRYYLTDKVTKARFYAYFGAIYSYKKQPSGIFAEIDWFSNQDCFDRTCAHMQPSEKYMYSQNEPKFIKLFMTKEDTDRFNEADYETQINILKAFVNHCNEQLVYAYRQGGNQ